MSFQTRVLVVAIIDTTIAASKGSSGVMGVEDVLFFEVGLGDAVTAGVDEYGGIWLGLGVVEFVWVELGDVAGGDNAAA